MENGDTTESAAAQRSDGRITVTVAVSAPQSTKALAVALPVQQKSSGGGREDCWSEGATEMLIDAWGERYVGLSRGNLKQQHWREVADIVNGREEFLKAPKSDIQCKNRIDTVKKKYKMEKAKIGAGHGPTRWPLFDKMDRLIGPSAKPNTGIRNLPVGNRSAPHLRPHKPSSTPPPPPQQPLQKHKQLFEIVDSDSSESEPELSGDSFPHKRPRFMNPNTFKPGIQRATGDGVSGEKDRGNWGKSVKQLSEAILKFGEAYERTESSWVKQMVDMEKQRMKFAKEMELQRMQFFVKTQMDLTQLHNRSQRRKEKH